MALVNLDRAGPRRLGASAVTTQADWTDRGGQLDEYGRNCRSQADFRPNCNALMRVFVLFVAVLIGANLHVGSARAAGESAPTDLSAQVDGIVSSALGAAQQEPAQAQETANTIVDQALTLAHTAAAEAAHAAAAAPLAAQSVDAGPPIPAVAADSIEIGPPERTPPAPPRHVRAKKKAHVRRAHVPVSHSNPRPVVGGLRYDGSSDTITPSPARPSPAAPAKASPRPERSAPPQPPRLPGPLPPRPDASSSGQAGGQNAPVPLLFATLLGVLAVFALHFLPRLLPLLAFRKPRRIVLPSWHPG
jgi:hypothetical protein